MNLPLFALGITLPEGPEILIIVFITALLAIFGILPFWLILKKAGLHPVISLIAIAPFGAFLVLFYLAFARWPALSRKTDIE